MIGARHIGLLLLLALPSSCARQEKSSQAKPDHEPATPSFSAPPAPARAPTSEPSSASWVAELRSVHGRLDGATHASERHAVLQDVERLFESAPRERPEVTAASEVLSLRQDLASRAARIELDLGDAVLAARWAQRGLALSQAPSLFRANLLLDAAEARRRLGDDAGARTALLEAMQINQNLLEEELENP